MDPFERSDAYDRQAFRVMARVLAENSNCVDVGCCEGLFLREMVRLCPNGSHYAFEPLPQYQAELRRLFPKAHLFEIALSNQAGTSTFQHVVELPGYSGLRRRDYFRDDLTVQSISVRTETLDSLLPESLPVDFIKVDVEGAEYQVFEGARRTLRTHRPYVVFEHGLGAAEFYGTTPEMIWDLLVRDCGLKLSLMDDWLAGGPSLDREGFFRNFYAGLDWYFMAHPDPVQTSRPGKRSRPSRAPAPLPSCSVVIAAHDPGPGLMDALESIAIQSVFPAEVILIDAASGDPQSLELLGGAERFHYPFKMILETCPGTSPAAAMNLGARRAGGEVLVFLDPKDKLTPSAIEDMLGLMRRRPGLDVVWPDAQEIGPALRRWSVPSAGWEAPDDAPPWPTAAVRRAAFLKMGGFSEAASEPAAELWGSSGKHGLRGRTLDRIGLLLGWTEQRRAPGPITRVRGGGGIPLHTLFCRKLPTEIGDPEGFRLLPARKFAGWTGLDYWSRFFWLGEVDPDSFPQQRLAVETIAPRLGDPAMIFLGARGGLSMAVYDRLRFMQRWWRSRLEPDRFDLGHCAVFSATPLGSPCRYDIAAFQSLPRTLRENLRRPWLAARGGSLLPPRYWGDPRLAGLAARYISRPPEPWRRETP